MLQANHSRCATVHRSVGEYLDWLMCKNNKKCQQLAMLNEVIENQPGVVFVVGSSEVKKTLLFKTRKIRAHDLNDQIAITFSR